MSAFQLYQGATYKLPIKLNIDGQTVTEKDVARVDFIFGTLIKSYPQNADCITCEDGVFTVSLTCKDTAQIPAPKQWHLQAKVTFNDGSVKPSKCTPFFMNSTHFPKEVTANE